MFSYAVKKGVTIPAKISFTYEVSDLLNKTSNLGTVTIATGAPSPPSFTSPSSGTAH